ncbi:kinase-like protein [Hypoxylon crocopeplum]|nr:kinase-like protein [Hypoxylon crocopeplum]
MWNMSLLSDDEQCHSPVSSAPEFKRPLSLDGASAWRDHPPELVFDYSKDSGSDAVNRNPNDPSQNSSGISEAEHSSTCHDRGDSAHLESTAVHLPSNTDTNPTKITDQILTGIGSGVNSRDLDPEFLNVPRVTTFLGLLENALRNASLHPKNDGKWFIPIDDFDAIITPENIRQEIQFWLPKEKNLDTWVRAIWDTTGYASHATRPKALTSRRKIFAILVLSNMQHEIASFILEGIWDKDLPFESTGKDGPWVYHPSGHRTETRDVECFEKWSSHDKDIFDTYQWRMLSPIFDMTDGKATLYHLHSRIALPFIEEIQLNQEAPTAILGGQGVVSRVEIHRAHYKLEDLAKDQPKVFAIKRLHSVDKDHFNSEVESLKRFSNGNYPHLIKLFATYYDSKSYHLIFPWADGNLRDFWKENPMPNRTYELALWIADQCRGIADGLKMIHRDDFEVPSSLSPRDAITGRHGDIKPENILRFKESANNGKLGTGLLKISDFGLTRWHRDISNNKTYMDRLTVSKSYRAPEYDLEKPISQPWDIWTLACLYLEFLTWYLLGWDDGVDKFSKNRSLETPYLIKEDNFFNLGSEESGFRYKGSLKSSVIDWINNLYVTEGCSQFIREFLDLISDHMLRIRLEERRDCQEIVARLNAMYNKCKDNDFYCFQSVHNLPKKRKTNFSDRCELHETVQLEFSDGMMKQLSQTSSVVNSTIPPSHGPFDDMNQDEITTSPHTSARSRYERHNTNPRNYNHPSLDDIRPQSAPLPSPASPLSPTPTRVGESEDSRRQITNNLEKAQVPSSTSIPLDAGNEIQLPTDERSGVPPRGVIKTGSTLLRPHDHIQGAGDQDGTSSQRTEFEERSGSSISSPPSDQTTQPSLQPSNLEVEQDTRRNGPPKEGQPIPKLKRWLLGIRGRIPCFK